MDIQVQFNCPVGVIVDTETGEIKSVHVWDHSIETNTPTGASRDEYIKAGHPDFERATANDSDELRELHRRHGASLFESMPLDHPEVVKAIAVAQDPDNDWPAWEFGP